MEINDLYCVPVLFLLRFFLCGPGAFASWRELSFFNLSVLLRVNREPVLAPGLVQDHGRGIGQVQAPAVGNHGYADDMGSLKIVKHGGRQAPCLGPENKDIILMVRDLIIWGFSPGRDREYPGRLQFHQQFFVVVVYSDIRIFVVIQPRAAQLLVIHLEAQGADQVQTSAAIGAKTDDIAGIGLNKV